MTAAAKFLDRKVIYPGTKFFSEGEEGNRAFLVESGLVEIAKKDSAGNEVVIGTVGKGGIFGEMALIDNQPRMASARAVQETVVIQISKQAFEEKLQKADPFIRGLLNIFVRNIRSMSKLK